VAGRVPGRHCARSDPTPLEALTAREVDILETTTHVFLALSALWLGREQERAHATMMQRATAA
jgi:hypothetical protein